MTKVLWHSVAPWCPTGYGAQTNLFARRLAKLDNIDLRISSVFGLEGKGMPIDDIWVYPGSDWSQNALQWTQHHGAGDPVTVITLMDVWPLNREYFKEIAKQGTLASWVPIDHDPAPMPVIDFFEQTGSRPIAMSRFGEQKLKDAGLDPLYVPHGVNTDVYKPMDKMEVRKAYGFDQEAFTVGMVANNQGTSPPRKAFSEAFLAFAEFRSTHPDAILCLHCEMAGTRFREGVNLWRLLERFGIPLEAIKVTPQVLMQNGVSDFDMARLYNSFDVLLNPSYGEGFGVPIIEAQACGTPVIVTDHTAMPELVGAGWTVGGNLWDDPKMEAFFRQPNPQEIVTALELAYEARDDEEMEKKARLFALGYDGDAIVENYWLPVLEELGRPREVQPLVPNRAMRRAAKKQEAAA